MEPTSVAIIGATGYTGLELARLLLNHPQVKIAALTSEKSAGQNFSQLFPAFQSKIDKTLQALDPNKIAERACLAFLCLPHQQSMETVKMLRDKGVLVIDLSADFRLSSAEIYETWYGEHRCQELLKEAVYGLPELHREKIKTAKLVANPGCYPTSCILGLAPLIKNNLVDLKSIHCDAKSGVSGAGRQANVNNLFSEVSEGLKAYKVGVHRHTSEIEQELSNLSHKNIILSFTPHLIPINRGILATSYAQVTSKMDSEKLFRLYEDFYQNEPFVRIRPLGTFPSTQEVKMTNYCDIGVYYDPRVERAVIISTLDNLTKGASGQAVQNMNLMLGYEETAGLTNLAPIP